MSILTTISDLLAAISGPIKGWFENRQARKKEIVEADLEILKELWKWLPSLRIERLVTNYSSGSMSGDLLDNFTTYLFVRNSPEYQFYDKKLEKNVSKFDTALRKMIGTGSLTFFPNGNRSYSHAYRFEKPGSKKYYEEIENLKDFADNEVATVKDAYDDLVDHLKKERLYHHVREI